jgi:hypothetical protein
MKVNGGRKEKRKEECEYFGFKENFPSSCCGNYNLNIAHPKKLTSSFSYEANIYFTKVSY